VVNLAIWGHPVDLNPKDLVLSEVNLVGSICYNRDHPATIRLVQDGRIDRRPRHCPPGRLWLVACHVLWATTGGSAGRRLCPLADFR